MTHFKAIFLGYFLLTLHACSTPETDKTKPQKVIDPELPSNSFSGNFKNSKTNYSYNEKTETHDYSGNWDIDGDGKKDSVRFVGNGGAHLQFSLVVKVSSTSSAESFEWIYSDYPLLETYHELIKRANESSIPNFVIHDFNNDKIDDIFVNVGNYGQGLPPEFEKRGLKDGRLVLTFDQSSASFRVRQWKKQE